MRESNERRVANHSSGAHGNLLYNDKQSELVGKEFDSIKYRGIHTT